MGQQQLVTSPRHANVKEASLLLNAGVTLGQNLVHQRDRERQLLSPRSCWEAAVDQAGHEDHREFQALSLVYGQDSDRIGIRIDVRRGRVVASIDERLEVGGD